MTANRKQAKAIRTQFREELIRLAEKTNEEIEQMLNDYSEIVESNFGKPPTLYEYLETYNNMIIEFLQDLLTIRTKKRLRNLKSRITGLEDD
jgi:hypothetical protein